MAGPTPFGYFPPSRVDFNIAGIDPVTVDGDTLILKVTKVGGDRVGLIFIHELNRGHSWIVIPEIVTLNIKIVTLNLFQGLLQLKMRC